VEWGQNVYGIGRQWDGMELEVYANETLSYLTDTLILLQNVVSEN